jgi:DNA ligase 1
MTFSELATYFKTLEGIASRNEMTEVLADLFRRADKTEIGKICYLLQGRVVPLFEAVEFGVADKFMIRAIAQAYNVDIEKVVKEFKKTGDLGCAAENCYHVPLHDSKINRQHVLSMYDSLYGLATESGVGSQEKKITLLAKLLQSVDPLSARYVARIPLDKLRLGFSDMTMLDSLSWMIAGDKSLRVELERVYNIRPDIGLLAEALKEHGMKGLSHVKAHVGAPILAALCQRIPTADEMIKKMGEVAVEPKYDGVRVQIHYRRQETRDRRQETGDKGQGKPEVKTFSRNLENTTVMFPELPEIDKELRASEVILDSEAIGIDTHTGKFIPFQETMTRKRKHNIEETRTSVPLKFFVFDILYKDGKDLLSTPLSKRRSILTETVHPGKILVLSPQIVTKDPSVLRAYHDEQLKKGLEGAVVKKWESPYEPGRRNFSWVKFKEEEGKTGKLTDTIDAVIMGYSRGEGKRSGFGIGMFLVGVRKGDAFVTVTKIGTGVSDELWKKLHSQLEHLKVPDKPKMYADVNKLFIPDVWVLPKIVVEIAGDDLTKSSTHGAGVAVRFPRLVRIRTDKSPAQVTSVAEILTMFRAQKSSTYI